MRFDLHPRLSPATQQILHAAQDLVEQGFEPTSARISGLLPDHHLPTIRVVRSKLIREHRLSIPAVLVVKLHEEPMPRKRARSTRNINLAQRSALDKILSISTTDRTNACRQMVRVFRGLK